MMFARVPQFFAVVLAVLGLAVVLRAENDLTWDGASQSYVVREGVLTLLSPEDSAEALSILNEARRAHNAGERGRALGLYEDVFEDFPRSIFAPEALYQTGLLRFERRQFTRSYLAFDTILGSYPAYGRYTEILGRQFETAKALAEGARPLIWGWLPGLKDRRSGITFYQIITARAPFSEFGPVAQYNAGLGLLELGDTEQAIDAFDRIVNFYPNHPLAPEAYLELGAAYEQSVDGPRYDQGSTREALSFYEDFLILHPQHPRVSQAEDGANRMRTNLAQSKIELGNWYFRHRSNFTAARVFYNEAITAFPGSPVAAEARTLIAEVDEAEAYAKANPPSRAWRWINWLWR